jgi:hypothetical protein
MVLEVYDYPGMIRNKIFHHPVGRGGSSTGRIGKMFQNGLPGSLPYEKVIKSKTLVPCGLPAAGA